MMKDNTTTEVNYWQSYSDMMSSLLMLFILLVLTLVSVNRAEMIKNQQELERVYEEANYQISEVIKTKQYIVNQLIDELDQEELGITIDAETGTISFNSNLLFDRNSSVLKEEGKQAINKFFPKYVEILFRERNLEYVDEIQVVGHTDTDASYEYNLELSQDRALSVAYYIMVDNGVGFDDETLMKLRNYMGANGKSFSRPVMNNGEIDMDASRRVEFAFNIKDSTLTSNIEDIINKSGEIDGRNHTKMGKDRE